MAKRYRPLTLDSKYDVMDDYIGNNKVKLTEHVITSVEYAIQNELPSVEVFRFKNSEFVVMLERESFKENVDNIFQFYLDEELYELCDRIVKIQDSLNNYEKNKTTTKRHKSKSSTKRKTKG